jgi:hypothetical protein
MAKQPAQIRRKLVGMEVAQISSRLSATRFHNSATSRAEPPFVRFEAVSNRVVALTLHFRAKSLHIRSTSTLLFGSAKVARCAASLGKSNRREGG